MKKLFLLLAAVLTLAGCDNKKSADELFKETASGVVVVLNEYYYELELPNGNSLYFTGLDDEGDINGLTGDLEEIKKNRNMITGTAFFIDNEGTLMTNRHVAQPDIDAVTARRSMSRRKRAVALTSTTTASCEWTKRSWRKSTRNRWNSANSSRNCSKRARE